MSLHHARIERAITARSRPLPERPWLVASLLGALASGCMALDLAGDLPTAPCASDTDCAHLESTQATGPCASWQCDSAGLCRQSVNDEDHDGVVSAACSGDPSADCDDGAPEVAPGAPEVSDGRDDDCDAIVDEVAPIGSSQAILYTSLTGLVASSIGRSASGNDGALAIAQPRDAGGSGAAFIVELEASVSPTSLVRAAGTDELPLDVRTLDAERLATDAWLVAAVPDGSCQRVSVALATRESSPFPRVVARFVDQAGTHFARGIRDDEGRDCTAPGSTLEARAPSLANMEGAAAVAWLAEDAATSGCTPLVDAPVLAHLVALGSTTIAVTGEAADRLGVTDDASPPALVAVPGLGVVAGFVDDGALVLVTLDMTGSSGNLRPLELIRSPIAPAGTYVGRPALALGPVVDGRRTLGALLSVGSCTSGDPVFVRFALGTRDKTHAPTERLDVDLTRLAPSDTSRDRLHALVYSDVPRGFWAVWTDGTDLFARGVDDTGAALGPAPFGLASTPLASITAIDLLGPRAADAPGLTVGALGLLPTGESVVFARTLVFP